MSTIKIFSIVLIPAICITLLFLVVFIIRENRLGVTSTTAVLEYRANDLAALITQRAKEIEKRTEEIAQQISHWDVTKKSDALLKSATFMSEVEAVVIAFSPEFLNEYRAKKYPDYHLEDYFGFLSSNEIPELYAPCIQRNETGAFIASQTCNHDDYYLQDWFLIPKLREKAIWVNPFICQGIPKQLCAYSIPLYYNDIFVGVVSSFIPVKSLLTLPSNKANLGLKKHNNDYFYLGNDGRILYHSREDVEYFSLHSLIARKTMNEKYFDEIDGAYQKKSGTLHFPRQLGFKPDEPGSKQIEGQEGTIWLVYGGLENGSGWILYFVLDEATALQEVRSRLVISGFSIAGVVLAVCCIAAIVFLYFNQPVLDMVRVAQLITEGRLNAKVNPVYAKRRGILGKLARNFNIMIEHIQENIDIAVGEETQRKQLESELLIAQRIQRSFMPSLSDAFTKQEGFSLFAELLPAKYVAGDFFDYWMLDSDRVALIVGDVSGKGVPAAMIMIQTRTLIRQVATKPHQTPGEVLSEVNSIIAKSNEDSMFVTLFFAYYNIRTGVLSYCNAGHCAPIVRKATGEAEYFPQPENPLVGIFPVWEYVTIEKTLEKGDVLFIYTDGATDITNTSGKAFGDELLFETVCNNEEEKAEPFVKSMFNTFNSYMGTFQQDDVTVMVLTKE